MKKTKKPVTSRAAKKATLAKKKSAPVKAAAKKKPAVKAAAKKAAKPAKKAAAPKKAEPKAKKALAATTTKKAPEKVAKPVAAKVAKEAKPPKVKPEKEPKAKKAIEPKAVEVETAPAEEYEEAEVYLTDAEGRRYCRVKDCDQLSMVDAYCRYHYLLFWKKIQIRKEILTAGKLERYIEDLTARYPDKYLEMLRKDLRTEKDFTAAIAELEIDDSGVDSEYEDEAQSYLDEVRGHSGEGAGERDEESF